MPKELFVKLEKHSGIAHVQEVATKAALIRTEKKNLKELFLKEWAQIMIGLNWKNF